MAVVDTQVQSSNLTTVDITLNVGAVTETVSITSDAADEVEEDNFPSTADLDAVRPLADGLKAHDAIELAQAVVRKADRPVNNKALQYLAWSKFPDLDPKEFFLELLGDSKDLFR